MSASVTCDASFFKRGEGAAAMVKCASIILRREEQHKDGVTHSHLAALILKIDFILGCNITIQGKKKKKN